MDYPSIISAIDAEIAKLTKIRVLLSKGTDVDRLVRHAGSSLSAKPKQKRKLSAEGRARIAEAQKKRWAARRKATK